MLNALQDVVSKIRVIYVQLGSEAFLSQCDKETRLSLETYLKVDVPPFMQLLERGDYEQALLHQEEMVGGLRNTKWAAQKGSHITGFIMGRAQELERRLTAIGVELANAGKLPMQAESLVPLDVPGNHSATGSETEFEIKLSEALRCLEAITEAIRPSVKRLIYKRYLSLMKFLLEDYKEFHRYLSV